MTLRARSIRVARLDVCDLILRNGGEEDLHHHVLDRRLGECIAKRIRS